MPMIREASEEDIPYLKDLFDPYIEKKIILFRSEEQIRKDLSETYISCDNTAGFSIITGSVTVKNFGGHLFEIRSLVIHPDYQKNNIGALLLDFSIRRTIEKSTGSDQYIFFALTLVPDFFIKSGFYRVNKEKYPAKIFFDCNQCSKKDHCDEVAVEKVISNE